MSDGRDTIQVLARHLGAAVAPLDRAFRDPDAFRLLMSKLGWNVQDLPAEYVAVADAVVDVVDAVEALADDASLEEVLALLEAVGEVYTALDALATTPQGADPAVFLPELARNVFEVLLSEYLKNEVPALFTVLETTAVVRFEDSPATANRPGFVRIRFEWERIPEALGDPASIPASIFAWGADTFDFRYLAELLSEWALAIGLPASVDRVGTSYADAIQSQSTGSPAAPIRYGLTLPFFDVPVGGGMADVGLSVTELPAEGSALPGIFIGPLVPDGMALTRPLGDGWTFAVRAGSDLAQQLGIVLRPGEIAVRYPFAPGQTLPSAGFGMSLDYTPVTPALLFGEAAGTRLELAGAKLSLDVDVVGGDVELKLGAEPHGLALILSAASLDGFLGGVLGADETRIEVPLGIGWSNRTGLDFMAGAGFELTLYPHLDLGVLRFDRIDLAMRFVVGGAEPAQIDVRAAAAFSGELGPIAYAVDGLGVQLPIRFESGNAGPFDIGFGVLWPTGLGLVVDAAGIVTGGGFISLDPDAGRYSGILALNVFTVGVTAIGILDTKDGAGNDLPAPGFSLLLSISTDFPPIQLGYGFTLNAVGGLAAINRRIDTDAFLAGVRTGSLDSVLFPEDPVQNANTIISNLTAFFPVAMDRYVFGPMAILGWGTPALVEAELGILVEVPDPVVIALIGQASVAIPTEEVAIIALHFDVLGILDLGNGTLAVDASLRDSYVTLYALYGDMAMRLSWGSSPNFALSVGGLNPHFSAPVGFPTLRAVTVSLGLGDNPRVTLEGYFAVTSNSLQFGAHAELYAAAAGFSVKGWVGFDALLIFVPLSFRFDYSAGMGLYKGSSRIAGITVDGHLTGPSPFHAWGKGCVSLLFLDVCVPFDATFGERHVNELPPSDPWPLLEEAIRHVENWNAELAAGVSTAVTLREPAGAPGLLLLHPMGSATLRQKVLPFNRMLERFGEYAIQGPDRYDIAGVDVGATAADEWSLVTDHFPPGNFEALSETEKLSRPSFESMDAGVSVGGDFVDVPEAEMKVANVEYETSIIDSPWDTRSIGVFLLERTIQLFAVLRGSNAFSPLSQTGASKFSTVGTLEAAVTLDAETYAVATADTLEARADVAAGVTKGAALSARKRTDSQAGLQVVPTHELQEVA